MAKIIRRYQSEIYGNYRLAYATYGVLTGIVLAIVMLLHRALLPSNPPASPESFEADVVIAVAIFLSAYRYRSTLPDKQVMLKELLLLGMGTAIVAAIVYGLLLWLVLGAVYPDLVDTFIQQRISLMPSADQGVAEAMAIEKTRAYTAGDWAFIGGFRIFVISIIFTFFSAIIFRTQKSPIKQ